MKSPQKPLQVYVEEAEMRGLVVWARERGWTRSQAVRAALRALLRKPDEDPLLQASGMIQGLPRDLATRFDDYMAETFVAPSPKRARRARARVRR